MEFEPTASDDEDALLSSVECSRVGVSVIDFFTVIPVDGGGSLANEPVLADERVKPCWSSWLEDPNRTLGGPAVPPGEYQLVSLGRRSNGAPWCAPGLTAICNPEYFDPDVQVDCSIVLAEEPLGCDSGLSQNPILVAPAEPACVADCEDGQLWSFVDGCFRSCVEEASCDYCSDPLWTPQCDGDEGCHPSYLTCECRTFSAVEDETLQIRDIVLEAPPECQDGIDSDGDGLVDELDPGCLIAGSEDLNVFSTQLVFDFSLLSGNDSATCTGVQASRFEISLDGTVIATPPCRVGQLGLNIIVGPGLHEISVRALAFEGEAITRTKSATIEALTGGVLDPQRVAFDFADTDFLDPIVSAAQFVVGYAAAEGVPTRFCVGAPGLLAIEEISIRMLDAVGEPVQPAVRVEFGEPPLPGMPLAGDPLPCTQQAIITETLRWGAYQVEVEAFSAEGELCFSNVDEPQLMAPGTAIQVIAPRVEPVAASCRDCNTAQDCGGLYRCEEGICVP